MQCSPRIEILLHHRQQILAGAVGGILGCRGDPRVREGGMGGHASGGVDGQAALNEVAGVEGDAAPVFEGREGVVRYQDSLHLFEVRVPVERGIATQEEIGDDADCPYIALNSLVRTSFWLKYSKQSEWSKTYTGFPWPDFLNISGAM